MKKLLCLYIVVIVVVIVFLFGISGTVNAGQLVYDPVNPSFGGSPLNGSWMLNSAQIQDPHGFLVKKSEPTPAKNPLETFQKQITDRIFYTLSSRIVNAAFGEEGLVTGHYTVGEYNVDINSGDSRGISVKITDNNTLNSTTVEVPYY